MFAAARNLGDDAGGMSDLLARLRAREKARHGVQVRRIRLRCICHATNTWFYLRVSAAHGIGGP